MHTLKQYALSATLLCVVSPSLLAQGEFRLTIDQAASDFVWSGTSTLGAIEGVPDNNFEVSGTIDLDLTGGAQPIASGRIVESDALVLPDLEGFIPNPIPGFPPLARIYLVGMRFSLESNAFAVNGNHFSTMVTLTMIAGTLTIDPIVGATTVTDLTGIQGPPSPATGDFNLSGGNIHLVTPQDSTFSFTDPGTGISADLTLTGVIVADYDCSSGSSNYCSSTANSTGSPALIDHTGSNRISANNLVLRAGPVPQQPGIFFYSRAATAGGAGVPFGNGLRCVGNSGFQIFRLPVVVASGGNLTFPVDIGSLPSGGVFSVGSVFYFQAWFRDPAAGGAFFDLSDGLRISFCP